jgi:hypothetical protein
MSDGLDQQREARDQFGRWRKGQSGNLKGRTPGSKNRSYHRRADPERAAKWTENDWWVFYQRTFQQTEGGLEEKHGAAWTECVALWLSLDPPPRRPGLCAHCGKPLDVPLSSVSGAPIRIDGAWTHWGCAPWFCHARWHSAKAALRRLGISENAF